MTKTEADERSRKGRENAAEELYRISERNIKIAASFPRRTLETTRRIPGGKVHWGHVGDQQRLGALLKEVDDLLELMGSPRVLR